MAFMILLVLLGLWIIVNGINGNIPSLIMGDVAFNSPGQGVTAGPGPDPNVVGGSGNAGGTRASQTGQFQG